MKFARIRRSTILGATAAGLVASSLLTYTAAADTVADKARTVETDDGWLLTVTKTAENLDRYPALSASPTSREGFVSLKAIAEVTGNGRAPINSGAVTYGYQIGCQVDVSTGLTLGMGFTIGPNASLNISWPPSVSVGGQASVSPNISTTLKPGTISTVTFGSKPFAAQRGSVTAEQVEVKVDACMGPVTMRSFATAAISTNTADNSVTVYGDPITL
ncbi:MULTISPECIES: MspA family porin [unclassified Nocardia]|uniref:MspA family porin n=2 Tax=Nocardia TaxID=1817 RepID=UPI00278C7E48|nr:MULTISPECIES: MspA family porin [unclassified Nocardia]